MLTALSQSAFGVNIAGEYSNGFNDCAFWLRGPGNDQTSNPDCSFWTNYATWNDTVKEGLMNFALASMDALIYPFFWTWKVSCILIRHLDGALGSIVSILSFWLAIGVSVFTFAQKQLTRAPVLAIFFLRHTTGPEINSYLYFSPFPCYLDSLFSIVTGLLVPRGQVRCRVPAQVTAFHASPYKFSDCFLFHN